MTDRIAISGNYSDFKLVKTRSVCQVVIELPLEKAEAFLSAFGVPLPGAEKPVALALLAQPKAEEKPKKRWEEYSRAQQAGILCDRTGFWDWLDVIGPDAAADYVRRHCGVDSRSKLDTDQKAASKWDALVSKYRTATGQQAELRS